jgi:hypothetical protein
MMNVDIAEVIRQKQQKQPRIVSTENGDVVDIDVCNGTVVVSTRVSPGLRREEEIESAEIVLLDD